MEGRTVWRFISGVEQAGLCDGVDTEEESKLPARVASGIPQDGDHGRRKICQGDCLSFSFPASVPLGWDYTAPLSRGEADPKPQPSALGLLPCTCT